MTAVDGRSWQSRPGPGSFRRQIVILTGAVTTFAVVILVVLVQLVLAEVATNTVARVLHDRTDAIISSADASSTSTQLAVPAARLDAGVAIYDPAGTLVAGAAPSSLADRYAELGRSTDQRTITVGDNRIRAQPFTTSAGARGVVVVTEKLDPYENAERYAFVVSVVAGLLMIAATMALAAWVSRRALRPVADMAATAEDWSEHDLSRRFDLGEPRNEITALGRTLDGLLDKVSSVIRSEQRLTSELAHELRTPLTAVQGGADLVLMRSDLPPEVRLEVEEMRSGTRRMADTITSLLELARSESSMQDGASCLLSEVLTDVAAQADSGAELTVDSTSSIRLAVPHTLAVRALSPIVQNAVRLADHVHMSPRVEPSGFVAILVDDDGPGVELSQRAAIFAPGHTSGPGAGLGLALSRRIARSVGGDVVLEPGSETTRFALRLPLA
jgi:two-component system, OmpR family, sensor kinase